MLAPLITVKLLALVLALTLTTVSAVCKNVPLMRANFTLLLVVVTALEVLLLVVEAFAVKAAAGPACCSTT